jgi:flagellar motor switch protein FliG
MGDLYEQEEKAWKEKIQLLDKRFREQIARREGELEEVEESIHEIHEEAMFSNFSLQGEKEYEEH